MTFNLSPSTVLGIVVLIGFSVAATTEGQTKIDATTQASIRPWMLQGTIPITTLSRLPICGPVSRGLWGNIIDPPINIVWNAVATGTGNIAQPELWAPVYCDGQNWRFK